MPSILKLPRRYGHFAFATIQAGITTGVAAAVSGRSTLGQEGFLIAWGQSWLLSWILMLPVVLIAAPSIRRLVNRVCDD
jgi:hypothetical protein